MGCGGMNEKQLWDKFLEVIKDKLSSDHNERLNQYSKQSEVHRIGGIKDMIRSSDNNDDIVIDQSSSISDDMKLSILQRWHSLNKH